MFALVTFFGILAILTVVLILSPSWRWPAGAAALVCAWFAAAWINHWLTVSALGYMPGNYDDWGIAIFTELTFGAAFAVGVFFLGALCLASRPTMSREE